MHYADHLWLGFQAFFNFNDVFDRSSDADGMYMINNYLSWSKVMPLEVHELNFSSGKSGVGSVKMLLWDLQFYFWF